MKDHRPLKIVSGGQTGADRGGLEAALLLGVPQGGWCPRGRRAEDGRVPDRFELEETESEVYAVRTRWNVRDSDATLLFTLGAPTGGSALTRDIALRMNRPLLHLDMEALEEDEAAWRLRAWLADVRPGVLNVAGSRESQASGLQETVTQVLVRTLSPSS